MAEQIGMAPQIHAIGADGKQGPLHLEVIIVADDIVPIQPPSQQRHFSQAFNFRPLRKFFDHIKNRYRPASGP